jgi:DNA-binding NarL/FixJ family response regulator
MNFQSVPQVSIHVIGRNKLQNNLLASFLEKETGFSCGSCESLQHALVGENGPGHTQLILLDSQSMEADSLRNGETVVVDPDQNGCMFALCNVDPGDEIEREALYQGVRGVFYNNAPLSIMSKGVQAIVDGELWYSRKTLSQCVQAGKPPKSRSKPPVDLTFREKEIIEAIGSGKSNQDIADHLKISIHTVKSHTYNIYKKLKVRNRLQASHWVSKYL